MISNVKLFVRLNGVLKGFRVQIKVSVRVREHYYLLHELSIVGMDNCASTIRRLIIWNISSPTKKVI